MSSNKKRLYQNKLKFSLLFILLFTLVGCSIITWPIWKSYNNSVEIMQLITDTEPVFNLSPILPYEHDLTNHLISNSLTDTSTLNLSITISDTTLNTSQLLDDLQYLSTSNKPIFLSVLPTNNITTDDYITTFLDIENKIETAHLNNIQLICYLQTANSTSDSSHKIKKEILNKYKKLEPSYVGVNIASTTDLIALDQIYNTFDASTELIVNDVISPNYTSDTKTGAEAINYIYYNLAIKYPRITTIYNPYVTLTRNKWLKEVNSTLLPTLDHRYITTYEHIISKPWITTKSDEVINTSPYQTLKDYDTLSGEVEVILSPDSSLLKRHKDSSKNTSYINYRVNSQQFKVQAYYPYELSLDTHLLPNSINRFKALAYNDANEMIKAPSIDLIVDNDNINSRAPRFKTSYPIGQTPIYTTDYIPILMYHTIADVVAPENQNSCVQTDVFDSQMKALIDNNYTPITFYDLENYLEGNAGLPEKPILITMDDGYLNNYTIAYPIYKKYNISATLFVSPYYMQQENTERHFGFNAAREMEASGLIDIESHGYDHTPFTKLSIRDVKYHISLSKGILEQNLGTRDVFTFAYPQFRNTYFTRKTLADQGVTFQITKLANSGTGLQKSRLKRINVPNTMAPQELILAIEDLTM